MIPGKTVLLWRTAGGKRQAIEEFCRTQGVRVLTADEREETETLTLAQLLGLVPKGFGGTSRDAGQKPAGRAAATAAAPFASPLTPPPDMMVLFGFDDSALTSFLQAYRQAQVPPVALKAMATPYNLGWTLPALHAALWEEHRAMTAKR